MKYAYHIITSIVVLLICGLPAMSGADIEKSSSQVKGFISGFNCVVYGKACPVDLEDPIIAFEKSFVLYVDKDKYYLIPNVDRAILSRYFKKHVRVTGYLSPKYKSIEATMLDVLENDGSWKTKWSKELEEQAERFMNNSYGGM